MVNQLNDKAVSKKVLPFAKNKNIVIQEIADELLVYDLETNKAHNLNATAAMVWKLCDGKRSALEISDEMSKRLKTLVSEELIALALNQLARDNLLENHNEDSFLNGLSRREVIKRIGFGSLIALPIVSTLVAPEAAFAQSCTTNNTNCATNGECCSLNCHNGSAGRTCCVPGVTDNFAPGATVNCASGPTACSSFGAPMCCSGSASTGSPGACPSGLFECVCN